MCVSIFIGIMNRKDSEDWRVESRSKHRIGSAYTKHKYTCTVKSFYFMSMKLSWPDDDGHVLRNLHSCISNYMQD